MLVATAWYTVRRCPAAAITVTRFQQGCLNLVSLSVCLSWLPHAILFPSEVGVSVKFGDPTIILTSCPQMNLYMWEGGMALSPSAGPAPPGLLLFWLPQQRCLKVSQYAHMHTCIKPLLVTFVHRFSLTSVILNIMS